MNPVLKPCMLVVKPARAKNINADHAVEDGEFTKATKAEVSHLVLG